MTKDFARAKRSGGKPRQANASTRSPKSKESAPWLWFVGGLACGIFISGLSWLAFQDPGGVELASPEAGDKAVAENKSPSPRFDFYTLLPEQTIKVEVDTPRETGSSQSEEQYVLQAGSFKKAEDADRRRAELLLLGLDAHVEEAKGDNGRWFRVYIGPFQSRSKLAKARSLTAQQGIDTLLLKRPRPARG